MRISLDKAYRTKDGHEVVLRKYEGKDDSYSGVALIPGHRDSNGIMRNHYMECTWTCEGSCIWTQGGFELDYNLVEVEEK